MLLLRFARRARGWTLADVAERTGIALPDLSQVEREQKQVWPAWRRRLAAALGTPEDVLFRPAIEARGPVAE